MEQYDYGKAVKAFREVHERAPGWIAGSINLAIALLNDTGSQSEDAKQGGGGAEESPGNFEQALALLEQVIARDPDNLNAHYCRGLILEFQGQGRTAEAHREFQLVADRDPHDGHAWFKLGATLTAPDRPDQPAGPDQAEELIRIYSRALDANPYLVTALYKLQQAYGWARKRDRQTELLAQWRALNPKTSAAGPGDTAEAFYGESGKYARVIDPFQVPRPSAEPAPPPRFDPPAPIRVKLPEGDRWIRADDLAGKLAVLGRARDRFGATVATFDADGDGRADLFLAAAVAGPKGVRDALLLNKGEGAFEDVSRAWGLPDDRASLGAAAADFDADRRIDLFLCGPSGYALLRNDAGKRFADVTKQAGMADAKALGLTARWLDLDQDGDLDLYVVNNTELAHAADALGDAKVPSVSNAAFRNIGKPEPVAGRPQDNWAPLAVAPSDLPAKAGLSIAFEPWPNAEGLVGPPGHSLSLAALDVDNDRDLDLIVTRERADALLVLNDRLGAFRSTEAPTVHPGALLVIDLDKDGRADLARVGGPVSALRNTRGEGRGDRPVKPSPSDAPSSDWQPWPSSVPAWRSAVAADLDLDTWPDLLGLPAGGDQPIGWARNDGAKLSQTTLPVGPFPDGVSRLSGLALADVLGDGLPDLVLTADGVGPMVARNLGNGMHWLGLDLGGRWKTSFDHMRTNPHGLGTRVTLEGQGLLVTHDHTTPSSGPGQSVGPVVLGLGKSPSAELVRLRWPDGTMQCELNLKGNATVPLAEFNRKKGSCPVLFTWNGSRFVCVGDFLGGGGLGYLVAPGIYSEPDRDESVAIAPDQLQAEDGVFRLSVTEPMDEVAYLDRLELVAVDRPPGVSAAPDERFAPSGLRPTGEILAWRTTIEPEKATDLAGRDLTQTLRAWDRDTADGFRRLDGWVGYAEEHGIVLDFGDRLRRFGPTDRLVLALAGWVEYPYSQTNYAAATAGVALRPPTVERRNPDGTWTVIAPDAGYPAGLPRLTTLDLTGKLTGDRCMIRLRTNMECYWDQAFVLVRDSSAEASVRQTSMLAARAVLGHRGYTREVSPDGKPPLLYDYDYVDPSPLALMSGTLTRHGDVRALLTADDDRFCLVGPGDEVRLEFDATRLPDLPDGWTRSYVLKAVGYCKDSDPFTATGDRVGPLPWRAMPPFPFADGVRRPVDPAYEEHLRRDQTRPAGLR
jgi:tetratricopeptide (TPR) repeat protein